jgi:hypothetical protein
METGCSFSLDEGVFRRMPQTSQFRKRGLLAKVHAAHAHVSIIVAEVWSEHSFSGLVFRGGNFVGYWLLSIGYWLLPIVHWLLAIVYWLLPIGYWLLSIG